MLYRTALI